MQTTRINITLPNDLARDLRKIIPARSRSRFIAEAVKAKLPKKRFSNREWAKSLRANRKLYEEIHKDWAPLDVEGWPD